MDYKCSRCGATSTDNLAALGHNMVVEEVFSRDCYSGDVVKRVCSRGDLTEPEARLAPRGHHTWHQVADDISAWGYHWECDFCDAEDDDVETMPDY